MVKTSIESWLWYEHCVILGVDLCTFCRMLYPKTNVYFWWKCETMYHKEYPPNYYYNRLVRKPQSTPLKQALSHNISCSERSWTRAKTYHNLVPEPINLSFKHAVLHWYPWDIYHWKAHKNANRLLLHTREYTPRDDGAMLQTFSHASTQQHTQNSTMAPDR